LPAAVASSAVRCNQKLCGIQQGFHNGLLEAIELGLSLRFGEKGLRLMGRIRRIDDIDRLKAIKNAIISVPNVAEFQKIVEN
jgi:hypothetical protein